MIVDLINWSVHNKTNGMSIGQLYGVVLTRFESLSGVNKEVGYNQIAGGVGDTVGVVSVKPRDVNITLRVEHYNDSQYYSNLKSVVAVFHAGDRIVIAGDNLISDGNESITGALTGYVTECNVGRMNAKGCDVEIGVHCVDPYIYRYDNVNSDIQKETLFYNDYMTVDATTTGASTFHYVDLTGKIHGNTPSKIRGVIYTEANEYEYWGYLDIINNLAGKALGDLKVTGEYYGNFANIQGEEFPTYFNAYEGEIDCFSEIWNVGIERPTLYYQSDFDLYVYPDTDIMGVTQELKIVATNLYPDGITPYPEVLRLKIELYCKERWL